MFKLEFSTDNAAFQADTDSKYQEIDNRAARNYEAARILRHVANLIERGTVQSPVMDINGNPIGKFSLGDPTD